MAKVEVNFAGSQYLGESLDSDEETLLYRHVLDYLAAGNDFIGNLFKENKLAILAAAQVAKYKFNAAFGGMLAPDAMVGVSLIRPGHILRNTSTTESCINTWDTEGIQGGALASGTDNWIGYSTNNATAMNVDKEACILAMGVGYTQGQKPVPEALQYVLGRITFPQVSLRHAMYADNPNRIRAVRHHPLLLQPKETARGIIFSEVGGRQELMLLGLTFGTGKYLRTQEYTTVAT